MVYVDPKNLGYRPFYERWLKGKTIAYGEPVSEALLDLYSKYVPPLMDRIYEGVAGDELVAPMDFITPRTNLNCIQ